jgi:dienelactone hydrolase
MEVRIPRLNPQVNSNKSSREQNNCSNNPGASDVLHNVADLVATDRCGLAARSLSRSLAAVVPRAFPVNRQIYFWVSVSTEMLGCPETGQNGRGRKVFENQPYLWTNDPVSVLMNAKNPRCAASLLMLWLLWPVFVVAESPASTRLARTNLLLYREAKGAVLPVRNAVDWQSRRTSILESMQQVMGRLPALEKRCRLEPQIVEEVDCGDYVRRWLTYTAEPGARVPAYLLIPKRALTAQLRAPAVLALHQTHSAGQKVVVGLGHSPNDEYGVELVKRGFVVLAPPYTMLANYWPDLKALGYQSGTMKSIWDNIRGLDYLSTLPFVKTNGFGAIGHSLGGHNSVFTAVFDERIKVVVSSCGLDAFVDYYGGDPQVWKPERGWCQTRYMPALTNYAGRLAEIPFDFHELIGALAPRLCFISAPVGDTNFKWRSVDDIANAASQVYRLYGLPGNLQVAHPDCAHLFPREMREKAYRLLEDNLR